MLSHETMYSSLTCFKATDQGRDDGATDIHSMQRLEEYLPPENSTSPINWIKAWQDKRLGDVPESSLCLSLTLFKNLLRNFLFSTAT